MTASAAQNAPEEDAKPVGDLARKLQHLFETKHPKDRGPYTLREAATMINEAAGEEVISFGYIGSLRNGSQDNPSMKQLAVLSAFFGEPVGYFFPDEASQRSAKEVELASAIKDPDVHQLALAASGLSAVSLKALIGLTDTFRTLEKRNRGRTSKGE